MQEDTKCKLGLVKARSRQSLSSRLLSLHGRAGLVQQKTAMRLCAEVELSPERHPSTNSTIEIRHCHSDEYIAVSCPWDLREYGTMAGRYRLATDQAIDVIMPPDIVLDRILNFKYCNPVYLQTPYWLDKICINQGPSPEKESAMHSMDLVYQYSGRKILTDGQERWVGCSLGLLFVEIQAISELVTLRGLLSSKFSETNSNESKLFVPVEEAVPVLNLIEKILSDTWWRRAWIFQEEFLASRHMILLLPCKLDRAGLFESEDGVDPFGKTSGEIEVSPLNFRTEVTTFCLALYPHLDEAGQKRCNEILKHARRYTFLYRSKHGAGSSSVIKAMSPAIFEDIGNRGISVPSDILAITANCCRYITRLNANVMNDTNESLSVAILTLFIMNGEILRHNLPREVVLIQNIFACLHAIKLQIHPPMPAGELIFIKMCRFPTVTAEPAGLSVRGVLSRLDKKIKVDISDKHREDYWSTDDTTQTNSVTEAEAELLELLASHLQKIRVQGGDALHTKIIEFLAQHEAQKSTGWMLQHWSLQHVQVMMAKAVCRALAEGKYLWLSRLHNPGQWTPWLGIFITDEISIISQSVSFAFTASKTDHELKDRGAKLARKNAWICSLEVTFDKQSSQIVPRKWLNGLHFFNDKEHPRSWTVPWPQWMR